MNKKKISLLLSTLMVASTMFMGCSNSSNNKTTTEANDPLRKTSERMITSLEDNKTQNEAYANEGITQDPSLNTNDLSNQTSNKPNMGLSNTIIGGQDISHMLNNEATNYSSNNENTNNFNTGINGGNTPNISTDNSNNGTNTSNIGINGGNTPSISTHNFNNSNITNTNPLNSTQDYVNFTNESNTITDTSSIINNASNNMLDTGNYADDMSIGINNSMSNESLNNNLVDSRSGYALESGTLNALEPQVSGRGVQSSTWLPKEYGKVTMVRTIGGVELTGSNGNRKPQGTIQVSFKLSGEVLNEKFPLDDKKFKAPTQSADQVDGKTYFYGDDIVGQTSSYDSLSATAEASPAVEEKSLSDLILEAYEETTLDANSDYSSTNPTLDKRKALQNSLKQLLSVNGVGEEEEEKQELSNEENINIIFKDEKGNTISIPYKSEDLVPDDTKNADYVRHIIDLEGMLGGKLSEEKSKKAAVTDIPISFIIRNATADHKNLDEFATDTNYTFVGISGKDVKDNTLPIIGYSWLSGFTMGQCTTAKAPSVIDVKGDSDSIIYAPSVESLMKNGATKVTDPVYVQEIGDKFINMNEYNDEAITASGTVIRLNKIIFNDPDESITRVQIDDYSGGKYNCNLIPVNTNDQSQKYLEIVGLRDTTPYTFKNIYVTSNLNGKDKTHTIPLRKKGDSKAEDNDKVITTAKFTEPKLSLGAGGPKQSVDLPSGLKAQAVKNDATSLRYIFKIEDPESSIGEFRVTGLRGEEKAKIEKIVDREKFSNFYVVTLTGLTPNTDYGYVGLELDYTDFEGKKGVMRTSINQINTKKNDKTVDNVTEVKPLDPALTFSVDAMKEVKSEYPRKANIPVFIDDLNERFTRVEVIPSKTSPDLKVSRDGQTLRVTGITPNKQEVLTLNFYYKGLGDNDQSLTKYVTVSTPLPQDLDISSDKASVSGTEAKIVLEYVKDPKFSVKSLVVKDENGKEIKSSFDPVSRTITLTGLDSGKEYKGLVATFSLSNGDKVPYEISTFTVGNNNEGGDSEVRPTGKVAEFVGRVYEIALGRKPEIEGWNYWIEKLEKKEISASVFIAENLMTQKEFMERQLSKKEFVTTMYSLIVNREPDESGQRYWEGKYDEYRGVTTSIEELRIKIAREMMNESEFKELVGSIGLNY